MLGAGEAKRFEACFGRRILGVGNGSGGETLPARPVWLVCCVRLSHDSLTLTRSLTKLGKKDAVGFQNSCDSLLKAKDFLFLRDLGKLSSRTTYDPTPKLGPGEGFPAPYLADGIPGALWFCDR